MVSSAFPRHAPAIPFKYAFYGPSGCGRDGFIINCSVNQSNFAYTPAPPWSGNDTKGTMAGLPSSVIGKIEKPATNVAAVSGYTGHLPGSRHSIGTGGLQSPSAVPMNAPVFTKSPPKTSSAQGRADFAQQTARSMNSTFRMPGYAGHSPGHQTSYGKSFGSISSGEGRAADTPAAGFMNGKREHVRRGNLQPGVVMEPMRAPACGYTGHIPGRAQSLNFGKPFGVAAVELPESGGVGDPERAFIADVDRKATFPKGYIDRPARSVSAVKGYAGFRPKTSPVA